MNSSDIRYEARQLLTNLVGKYKLFLIPILTTLVGIVFMIHSSVTQQATEYSYLASDVASSFNLSSEIFTRLFSFIISLFFISTSYTLLEVYRKQRNQVEFKDSLYAFSSSYFFKILLVWLAQWLLLLPWLILILLPTFVYMLLMFSMFFSGHYPDAGTLSFLFIPSIVGYVMLIIKSLAYSQANLVLFDRIQEGSNTNPFHIIKESVQLMKGYKADLFVLRLSFIGWYLLIILTLGLASFYVFPYHQTAEVIFYERLKLIRQTKEAPL